MRDLRASAGWSLLLGLYVLALLVRLGVAGATRGLDPPLGLDEEEHYHAAVNLATGRGYALVPQQSLDGRPRPTAYRMPGPALIMAAVLRVTGPSPRAARLTAIAIAALSVPLLYLFGRAVGGRRAALLSALGGVFYPSWAYYSTVLLSEPFFVPALLGALLVSLGAARRGTGWAALAAGGAWGGVTLIKPLGLPMGLLVVGFLAWRSGWRGRSAAAAALGLCLVLAPWPLRNAWTMNRAIVLATEGGETLLGANNPYVLSAPQHRGMWVAPLSLPAYEAALAHIHDEVARDRVQSRLALRFLADHPTQVPRLALRKLVRAFSPISVAKGSVRWLLLGSYGTLLLLLAWGGARRCYRCTDAAVLSGLWILTMLVVTVVYWGNLARGRMLAELVLLPFGAVALLDLARLAAGAFRAHAPLTRSDRAP